MNRKKRGLVLLLCTLLLTLMFGTTVFAASSKKTVAKIGSREYTSLNAAVKAVKKGQTIKVTKGISASGTVTINRPKVNFTIDFGKHTYKYTSTGYAFKVNQGTVTIKNANVTASKGKLMYVEKGAKTVISSGSMKGIMIENRGTLTVKGGTFTGSGSSSSWEQILEKGLFYNYGTMTVSGGTVKAGKNVAVHNKGTLKITGGTFQTSLVLKNNSDPVSSGALILNYLNNGKITVTGGTFTSDVITFFNGGALTIKGGTFTSKRVSPVWNTHSTVKITGGTFSSKGDWATVWTTSDDLGRGKVTITDGKFTAANMVLECWSNSVITIKGGTFKTTSTYDPKGKRPLMLAFDTSKITVNGGTFTAKKTYLYYQDEKATVKLNKGTFNTKWKRKSTI